MQQEIESIIDCLRKGLCKYKEARPALSWRAIAQQSGVNRYFIKKILEDNSQDVSKNIDVNQLLLLTRFLNEKSSIRAAIDACEIPLREAYEEVFKAILVTATDKNVENMDLVDACQFEIFCILVLAHKKDGFSRELLTRIFGKYIDGHLQQLIEREKIKIDDQGCFKLSKNVYLNVPTEIRKIHIQNLVNRFLTSSSASFSHINITHLNAGAVKKLREMHKKFYEEVGEFSMNENNYGHVPVFSVSCCDAFILDNSF